ncbi:MAG: hypothetical protein PHI51_02580 [Candidatus Peribacteraceae bacterium]|nr:hypothetical protein [Candidatus Peribacteraceae bacterium]
MKQISVTITLLLLTACSLQPEQASSDTSISSSSSLASISFLSSASSVSNPLPPTPYALPPTPYTVHLSVPFSPQAPLANWDALHEETCEEMSLLLVHHFLEGTGITREQAETELQELIAWEEEHGFLQDVTVAELGTIAEQYFGYRSRVIENPSVDDLKRLLANRHPVIIPAAGRDLGNPYFSGEGPWYHMLVLTGYNEFFFVTNDVGTKRGKDYVYRFETLMNAIHDWTGIKEEIRSGARRVLIVE